MNKVWVGVDIRDEVVDFVNHWAKASDIPAFKIIERIGITKSKFYDWVKRFGKATEYNTEVPRDTWLLEEEKQAILDFHASNPLNGYRRLTYMMLDQDIVAVSPSTVYRVLRDAGVLDKKSSKRSKKGTGFVQPETPHNHWHCDISYINVGGTFYYLCSLLDGYSRYIVQWDLKTSMPEGEIELIIQRAKEAFPEAKPRVISDNGPQFISKDFKKYIKTMDMTHVRTSPFYPQSNGKIERWHQSLKNESIRPSHIATYEEALQRIESFVNHYNNERLHNALGYITPNDKLLGREKAIFASREEKITVAREKRAKMRQILKDMESQPTCEEPVGGYGSAGEQPEHLQVGGDDLTALSDDLGALN